MIKVDISNVWGQVTLSDLLAMEKEVAAAHTTLADGTGAGNDFLGWQNLPVREATEEITRIQRAAEKIRSDSDVFVVIGIGGSYLGPRAAIELLQGPNHNIGKGKGNPQIFFAGNGLSTRHWNELTRLLEGKDFSIAIISKSGTTTEPAIATRALRWMLERKYGAEKAKKRIYVTTDPKHGALRQMATEEGYESFIIPPNVGGRYSVLTAVGLLPMAVAGIAPMDVMLGAARARKELDIRSFENPAWQYAAIRNLHHSWEGKEAVRGSSHLGFARAAGVLERNALCLFGTQEFTRSVASRMSNLALATNPASKIVSADNLLVAPDEQMLLVHIVLPEEQTGNAPRVGFAPEETLSMRLESALEAAMRASPLSFPAACGRTPAWAVRPSISPSRCSTRCARRSRSANGG